MNRFTTIVSLVATAVLLLAVAPVQAAIELRFSPADTTIASGSPGRLAIYADQVIDLRTIEITVSYDTTVVTSLSGGPGELFTSSGYFLWSDFEEEAPGTWHGYTVIMGAGEYISGPGELYVWDVMGREDGSSPITVLEVRLFNPAGSLIPDTTLPPTSINVGQAVPVHGLPFVFSGKLTATPNPFNPRTEIQFELPESSSVVLTVFDVRGRQIAVLMDRFVEAGFVKASWDGKNSAGMDQPGGVYFFQMQSDLGMAWTKAVLIK